MVLDCLSYFTLFPNILIYDPNKLTCDSYILSQDLYRLA